jgi:phosphatidylglycerophosphate synthase
MATTFDTAVRVHTSLLAAAEKRLLVRIAGRLPRALHSDHLTALAALSMTATGACFWIARAYPAALIAAIALLAVNWFGDSLDGTLARVRHEERPRYGYYVDHVLDAAGILALVGGLVLGGWMSAAVGAGFLIAYYLLMIEIALAAHTVGRFHMSFWHLGPTELRIALAAGALQLLRASSVALLGRSYLLFDVGGIVAIVFLLLTFVLSALRHGRELYRLEPRGDRSADGLL